MSRFQIMPLFVEEQSFRGGTLYGTGVNTASRQSDELLCTKNNGKLLYATGLNKHDISRNKLLSDEEKKRYEIEFDKDWEVLTKAYREDQLDPTNSDFWGKVGRFTFEPALEHSYFDGHVNPKFLLLKWAIIAGGYSACAPSKEAAEMLGLNYYMITVEEKEETETGKVLKKLDVYKKLANFVDKAQKKNLLWFAWALDEKTQGFTEANSDGVIIEKLTEYLDGNLVKGVAKKKCVARVNELLDLFSVNREELIFEGLFKAAIHYGHIYLDNGTYVTADRRTRLKANMEDSILVLKDPNLREELKELKEAVEENLKR